MLAREKLLHYIKYFDYNIKLVIKDVEFIIQSSDLIKATLLTKLNLCDEFLLQIRHINKFYKVWQALKNLYNFKKFSSEFFSCKKLFNITLAKSDYKMKLYLN